MKAALRLLWPIIRQVVFPYDVYRRTESGQLSLRGGEPVPAPTATWIARILSVLATVVAVVQVVQEVLQKLPTQ